MKFLKYSPEKGNQHVYIDGNKVVALKRNRRDELTKIYLSGIRRPVRITESLEEVLDDLKSKKYALPKSS